MAPYSHTARQASRFFLLALAMVALCSGVALDKHHAKVSQKTVPKETVAVTVNKKNVAKVAAKTSVASKKVTQLVKKSAAVKKDDTLTTKKEEKVQKTDYLGKFANYQYQTQVFGKDIYGAVFTQDNNFDDGFNSMDISRTNEDGGDQGGLGSSTLQVATAVAPPAPVPVETAPTPVEETEDAPEDSPEDAPEESEPAPVAFLETDPVAFTPQAGAYVVPPVVPVTNPNAAPQQPSFPVSQTLPEATIGLTNSDVGTPQTVPTIG